MVFRMKTRKDYKLLKKAVEMLKKEGIEPTEENVKKKMEELK